MSAGADALALAIRVDRHLHQLVGALQPLPGDSWASCRLRPCRATTGPRARGSRNSCPLRGLSALPPRTTGIAARLRVEVGARVADLRLARSGSL